MSIIPLLSLISCFLFSVLVQTLRCLNAGYKCCDGSWKYALMDLDGLLCLNTGNFVKLCHTISGICFLVVPVGFLSALFIAIDFVAVVDK